MSKGEREDLEGQAEKTLSEIDAVKGQVEKLKELRTAGKISEEAYSELEGEYISKIESIILISQDLIQGLRNRLTEASAAGKEKEVIEAKRLIGALTEKSYQEEMAKLSKREKELDEEEKKLHLLIERLEESIGLLRTIFKFCPSCGNVNRPKAKFCRKCGALIAPSTADELYDKLLKWYISVYGGSVAYAKDRIDEKIASYMKQGFSREEAIRRIFEEKPL